MKALIYNQKNSTENLGLTLSEVEEPIIRDTDLLVKVMATAINPVDIHLRKTMPIATGDYKIMGFEFSGEVVGTGLGVSGFKEGDRVYG